jgi:hypothetical protein
LRSGSGKEQKEKKKQRYDISHFDLPPYEFQTSQEGWASAIPQV